MTRGVGQTSKKVTVIAVAAGAIFGTVAVAGTVAPGVAGAAKHSTGPTPIYVDCAAPTNGTGSATSPLNSLAAASAVTVAPGQSLLFDKGTVCSGELVVTSSGTAVAPVTVGTYGTGSAPQIVGTSTDAVLLQDASYVVVTGLNISNPDPGATLGTVDTTSVRRRGIEVLSETTTVTGITLEKLKVHDVDGDLGKDTGGSGGIYFDAEGTAPVSRFNDVLVTHNTVLDVSREGIVIVGTQDDSRPAASDSWPAASTNVVISYNNVEHLAGDGIVSEGTVGAIVEDNKVVDGNHAGTSFTGSDPICDAGIFAWNANSTVIQHNVVSHMEFNGCDGVGYDIDYNQDGTVVQDNVSLRNAGGFILLCDDPEVRTGIVRYNLSIDDASTFNESPCDIASGSVGSLDGISFYNNTFVSKDPQVTLELDRLSSMISPGNFAFQNNIIYATKTGSPAIPCGSNCTNNLFFNLPASGTDAVTDDPLFVKAKGASAKGIDQVLEPGSPAIGAGVAIAGAPSSDFFGNPLPTDGPPAIGFDQPPT